MSSDHLTATQPDFHGHARVLVDADALLALNTDQHDAVMDDVAALYTQEAKPLFGFLLKLGAASPELAADIVQATFEDAIPKWTTMANRRAWLRTVATRKLWKAQDTSREREDPTDQLPDREQLMPARQYSQLVRPDVQLEISEEAQRVIRYITQLPNRQRAILAWHLDGYPTEEIADQLGMTHAAVRQNLSRARGTLKNLLSGGDGA